jgi:hypothetical protein
MAFRSDLDVSGELCDKCRKPMNPERPGVVIWTSCQELGRQMVWLHIDCLQKIIRKHTTGEVD